LARGGKGWMGDFAPARELSPMSQTCRCPRPLPATGYLAGSLIFAISCATRTYKA